MNQNFMKEKPVMPLVISMALPMTFSMLVNALYNIIDSYFVARISEDAMTALSLVFPLQNLVNAVVIGFAIGINATIAYFLGAQKQNTADKAASLGTLFNMIHGLILAVVCIAITAPFLAMFTDKRSIIDMGAAYAQIVFLFAVPNAAGLCFEKIFQSVGRMKTSMLCMLIGCVTNIILDPFMIFGIGFFPEMGIRGAAIATGIGQMASLVSYLLFYFFKPIPVKIRWKDMKPEAELSRKMYSIGVPATLSIALPSVQVSALNAILAVYSASYVLVLGAYFKLQTFLYLTGNGVVQGMRPLIGYNYGAGESKRVREILKFCYMFECGLAIAEMIASLSKPTVSLVLGGSHSIGVPIAVSTDYSYIVPTGTMVIHPVRMTTCLCQSAGKAFGAFLLSVSRQGVIFAIVIFTAAHTVGYKGVIASQAVSDFLTAVLAVVLFLKYFYKEIIVE